MKKGTVVSEYPSSGMTEKSRKGTASTNNEEIRGLIVAAAPESIVQPTIPVETIPLAACPHCNMRLSAERESPF